MADIFRIPMALYAENRQKLLDRLSAPALSLPQNGLVLMQGGEEVMRYDTDHEPIFRQESFFHYLFGVKEPGFYGALDIDKKKAILFCPHLPDAYAVWMGKILSREDFRKMYEVDEVRYVEEIEAFLNERKPSVVYTLSGLNTDSKAVKPEFFTTPPGLEKFKVDKTTLFPEIVECRVIKSAKELDVLRYVNRVSSKAHEMVIKRVRPGWTEFQAEAVFRYETYYHGGCRNQAYTCICASGENGATLHYGHAGAPNDKVMHDGDLVVFDMGSEYQCFCSDITRSFPVNGRYTPEQRQIYETVLKAQEAVFQAMKPGVFWADMHRLANKVIVEELLRHGLLTGDVEDMTKHHIGALFMPHGLGHFMGLDTHDVGGYPAGVERHKEPGIRSLRANRPLEAGMVITVEPGVYFIEALLLPALNDPDVAKFLVADKIRQFLKFGGVRIEDDVIVTETGIENMTTAPRTVADIEALCAQGRQEFP
eukprot:TRINITY_DN10697_c0_g1_i1.p2 TRINITY_DN10697_c0_g1~~TRINITY_DN10697_c0_g1_i1.p2  ORF type:complete len:505 (-),score=142.57 TRINITY_DN10697_c0_g1_i1:94-1533(-)